MRGDGDGRRGFVPPIQIWIGEGESDVGGGEWVSVGVRVWGSGGYGRGWWACLVACWPWPSAGGGFTLFCFILILFSLSFFIYSLVSIFFYLCNIL